MAESIITLGIGSAPGSVEHFVLLGLNATQAEVTNPSTLAGTGSTGNLAGTGSTGTLAGTGSTGTLVGTGSS